MKCSGLSLAGVTLGVCLLMPAAVAAQEVTEPALKAAFIYNFAKFTVWPTDVVTAAEPLVMCVLGDAAVADALERTVNARMLAGHSLTVSSVALTGARKGLCHVLYLSGVTADRAAELVAAVRDVPVLTISDVAGFTEMGGIAQFYFAGGQLRFNVQIVSARRARLQISSRLLALSRPRND